MNDCFCLRIERKISIVILVEFGLYRRVCFDDSVLKVIMIDNLNFKENVLEESLKNNLIIYLFYC